MISLAAEYEPSKIILLPWEKTFRFIFRKKQEEILNGFMPAKDHFLHAVREASDAGAAGWVFHAAASFDLRTNTWFENLDSVEVAVVNELAAQLTSPITTPPPP
jgi:hypothetical protein